jgi:hypothetical protein
MDFGHITPPFKTRSAVEVTDIAELIYWENFQLKA